MFFLSFSFIFRGWVGVRRNTHYLITAGDEGVMAGCCRQEPMLRGSYFLSSVCPQASTRTLLKFEDILQSAENVVPNV